MVEVKEKPQVRALAAVGYLWILFLLPLLIHRENPFTRFHGKQGLVLFVFWILTGLVFSILILILGHLPLIGWLFRIVFRLAQTLLSVLYLILMAVGIYQAASGKSWRMPVLGVYAEKLKI